MDSKKEEFVEELSESIKWHYATYRRLNAVQIIVMILVAIAGVFTVAAGSTHGENQWFAESNALIAWGGITAVGAVVNQFVIPSTRAEYHLNLKMALKAIRGAVINRGLPVDEADRIRTKAWTNPDEAQDELYQWRGPEAV